MYISQPILKEIERLLSDKLVQSIINNLSEDGKDDEFWDIRNEDINNDTRGNYAQIAWCYIVKSLYDNNELPDKLIRYLTFPRSHITSINFQHGDWFITKDKVSSDILKPNHYYKVFSKKQNTSNPVLLFNVMDLDTTKDEIQDIDYDTVVYLLKNSDDILFYNRDVLI